MGPSPEQVCTGHARSYSPTAVIFVFVVTTLRFDPATSAVHAYDDFSQFRKWHQGLFDHARDEPADGSAAEQKAESPEVVYENAPGIAQPPSPPQSLPQPTPANNSSRYSTLYEADVEQELVPRTEERRAAPPPLPADFASLAAAGERRRDVTLLQKDGRDSAELKSPALSPLRSATSSPPRVADRSFEEDRQAFDALPTFSGASSPTTASADEEEQAPARAPSPPSLLRLSAMEERIEAEEAELASYLSWLDTQQQGGSSGGFGDQGFTPSPAATGPAAAAVPKERSSGIPRYAGGARADGADADGGDLRVFSPRDAAMRAEQRDNNGASSGSKIGRSAFQSRTLFDQY
jgi:hypothetical protein